MYFISYGFAGCVGGSFLRPFIESLESHMYRAVSYHPQAMII